MSDRPPGARTRLRLWKWALAALLLAGAACGGWRYWEHTRRYASIDDAYVHANHVEIAAQVTGPVSRVLVRNEQHVRAGQALFDIDPKSFGIALAKARAGLALAEQQQAEAEANVSVRTATVTVRVEG